MALVIADRGALDYHVLAYELKNEANLQQLSFWWHLAYRQIGFARSEPH